MERKFSDYSFPKKLQRDTHFSDLKVLMNGEGEGKDKVEKKLSLDINNSFLRFFLGIVESLGNNNTDWIKCLPKKWQKEEPNLQKAGLIQRQFEKMYTAIQTLGLIIKNGIKIVCHPLKYLKTVIIDLLGVMFTAAGDLKVYVSRKIAEQNDNPDAKPTFGMKVINKIKDANHYLKQKFKLAWNELSAPIRAIFKEIGETIVEFVKDLVTFFKSKEFAEIVKVFKCMGSSGMAAYEIVKVFYGFFNKISLIIAASSGSYGAAAAPLLAKMALGILCKFEEFGLAINFAAEAITTKKLMDKTFYFGKFIGQIIHALGTSRRKMMKRRFRRYYK
jgi:hypothetical protein